MKQALFLIHITNGGGEMKKKDKIIVEEKFSFVDEEKRKNKFNELFIKVIKKTEKTKIA